MTETYTEWLKYRPDYKTLSKWHPRLSHEIIEKHPRQSDAPSGFISRVVCGKPGYGKSMYCYKIAAKIFWIFDGCSRVEDEENCYKQALDSIIYRPQQLFDKVKEQRKKAEPSLLWVVDDGSVHMGRALFDQDRKTYRRLQGTIPTIREDVTGLLISTPKTNLLCKPFREFMDEKIEVGLLSNFKENRRLAKHYFRRYFPDDHNFRITLPYQEKFSNLCPQPFYSWYLEKKRAALNEYQELCDKLNKVDGDDNEGLEEDNWE